MDQFKKYNIILGWVVFAISFVVHLMTMEPTTSFWDCSEYVATSCRLEVGHPPGAPLFMLVARFFAIFATAPGMEAAMTNLLSVVCSGFTILFMFWSITVFARKMYGASPDGLTAGQAWSVLGAGLIGSLAYTFSDTFWFSSVETETYALASMLVAATVWAMLKWESVADEPGSARWLVLVAYLLGVSIGVRIIPLLTLPALAYIYYFRKYPTVTWKGLLWATLAGLGVMLAINGIIMPYTLKVGAAVDRWFVNGLGFAVNTGMVFTAALIFALCAWGIVYTHRKGKVTANVIMLCLTVVFIGYSSYAATVIRAVANPPMNSNNPDNPYGLISTIKRDQYGSTPIIYGQWYSSPPVDYGTSDSWYIGDDGRYVRDTHITSLVYPSRFKTILPRMYDASKAESYESWVNVEGRRIPFGDEFIKVPTFGENLKYFFSYQLNFMYWRYFLWNFVGRQSDFQSTGTLTDGNWLSGIKFIDELYLGPQDGLPSELAANKGRNRYYFLPFILGLIGLLYQLNRDRRNFWVVMWLFVMMGIAVIVYFNPTPGEPRERDYIFSGSFFAFSLWIGLGVLWVRDLLVKYTRNDTVVTAVAAIIVCSSVPMLLLATNWDDHNRSHRYLARDTGWNYLNACLPNSIILNYGDNDTFPLWYNQEVEGVRPDVKIMNMSYLGMDWYVDQMKQKTHEADPVPFSLPRSKYVGSNKDAIPVYELFDYPVDLKQAIDFVRRDDPNTKIPLSDGSLEDFLPAKKFTLPVNRQNAIACGIIRAGEEHLVEDTIFINIDKSRLYRHELMFLDMLATFDWSRPIFFTQVQSLSEFGLQDYLQFDGYAYRFVPIKTPRTSFGSLGRVDTEYLYDNLMNKFRYGNIADPRVYVDYYSQYNLNIAHGRDAYAALAKGLIEKGDTARAVGVLDAGLEKLPLRSMRYNYLMTYPFIEAYYLAGEFEKGNDILVAYGQNLMEYVSYFIRFEGRKAGRVETELYEKLYYLERLQYLASAFDQRQHSEWINDFFFRSGIE